MPNGGEAQRGGEWPQEPPKHDRKTCNCQFQESFVANEFRHDYHQSLILVVSLNSQVAPGQHEMSPVFRVANVSCDTNVLFMEALLQSLAVGCVVGFWQVMNREAAKMGLQVLFHEKPFAGINGSGRSTVKMGAELKPCHISIRF